MMPPMPERDQRPRAERPLQRMFAGRFRDDVVGLRLDVGCVCFRKQPIDRLGSKQ